MMEILFHYFDPLRSWSSSWSSPSDTFYQYLFCYSLFWKSLYMSQSAQSMCLCVITVVIDGSPDICNSSLSLTHLPFSFHCISSWVLFFPKSSSFFYLFGSFSKVHRHRGLLILLSFCKYLVLSSLAFSFLALSIDTKAPIKVQMLQVSNLLYIFFYLNKF